MPELPDIAVYLTALERRVRGARLRSLDIKSPFVLRTFDPPVEVLEGRVLRTLDRLGKRLVLGFDDELYVVIHLMIAGRLRWKPSAEAGRPTGKIDLAALVFDVGTLVLTEAGTKKRASLHVVRGKAGLAAHDPGGLEVIGPRACDVAAFAGALRASNRTLKRALTDPRSFSGIGNAYSDEILHAARMSPLKLTGSLTDEQISELYRCTQSTLDEWTRRLLKQFKLEGGGEGRFPGPGDITAFRPDFAVHGKFGQPCPVCGSPVQRIVRAENEVNYCARCQTGGKVLADRSLSRLLKDDWPDRIEDWEEPS